MKKLILLLTAAVLVLVCVSASADTALPAVVDNAGIFTDSEVTELNDIITRIRDTYQMDGVVLTTRLGTMSDYRLEDYADTYFEDNGYGLGDESSGFLLLVDMGNRYVHLSTSGDLIDYLTDSRVDDILDQFYNNTGRSYGRAAIAALNRIERDLQQGREEGSFRYDAVTGRRLSGIYNALTPAEAMFSLLCGAVAALILVLTVRKRYALRSSTYKFNRQTQTAMALAVNDERFIRQSIQRIPHSSGGHGGPHGPGGFGGGHGSSVHTSSGGHSHGGGGRHF